MNPLLYQLSYAAKEDTSGDQSGAPETSDVKDTTFG